MVWWIDAETIAGIDLGFTGLAEALDIARLKSAARDHVIAAVCGWLERQKGWLLIFDKSEQPEDIRPYLPSAFAGHLLITSRNPGHLLITSRNPDWDELGDVLLLDTWPRDKSIEFLVKRSGRVDGGNADMLAAELGDLPLALEEAAAYIRRSGQSFGGYLALYRQRFAELAAEFRPASYPNTVLTTWKMSLAAIEQDHPVAVDLLHILAFLAPDDIPRGLLMEHADLLPEPVAGAIKDGIAFDRAVRALRRYSLIKITRDAFSVHRLVQAVTRSQLPDNISWINAAVALVHASFPEQSDDVRSWPICARLRPHAEAVLAVAQDEMTTANLTSTR